MKKKSFYAILAILALLITSCGGGAKEFTVKNNSKEITGDLKGYLEVVDGNYTISSVSGLYLNVKFKAVNKLPEGKDFEELRAELLDATGMPLTGVGAFHLKYGIWAHADQIDKLKNALKNGAEEFAVQLEYDSWGACSSKEALKLGSKKAVSFSMTSKLTEASTSTSTGNSGVTTTDNSNVTSTEKSGSQNWNSILDSYEKYITQYIALLKKANAGDMSAMTEYASMMEKATEFADKLENASDDLSPAQSARFLKLQTKLTNAAAGL